MAIASVHLKDESYLTQAEFGKPKVTTELLVFYKMKPELYREVFYMEFTKDNGQVVKVITASDMSSEECSGDYLKIYLVDKTPGREVSDNINILSKQHID